MPSTGGYSPSPTRTGGGESNGETTLQRVQESIAAGRGTDYTNSWPSAVFVENNAFARIIAFDGYGASKRLSNQFLPQYTTSDGLLPRWEHILNVPATPGDNDVVRRARVTAAWQRFGALTTQSPLSSQLQAVLGTLFVGISHATPATAVTWWPGLGGSAAKITAFSTPNVTLQGLVNVQTAWYGQQITLSNCNTPANNGTYPITATTPGSSQVTFRNAAGVSTDNGVGGSGGSPTIKWTVTGPLPWFSTLGKLYVQLTIPSGYGSYTNGPNAAWWALVSQAATILDNAVPAWVTWTFWVQSSAGTSVFKLDEHDLDLEALS